MSREAAGDRVGDETGSDRYRHLIEHVQDAVVEFNLVDGEPVVSDINRAFVDVFGYDADEIRGEPLNEWVVPDWRLAEAKELDANTASGEINYQQVTRETATGLREFLYRGIPYDGSERGNGGLDGGFAVYTDLTEVSRNERRLEVLNRVLRHNLRNSANVIAGHTTRLLAELDGQDRETTEVAATIERAAHELERLAEEASHIRRVLEHPTDETTDIDPEPIVRSVVSEHRGLTPTASIEVADSDAGPVMADSRLRYAIESLVDNAIEHNPSPKPRVRVRIEESDGAADAACGNWVEIHVEDDGPRIPAAERDVIVDRTGITPTHHGSGLGLWLTELTVEAFGGEVSFGRSDLGGNDVSIRLRRS
ncbi:PAS domain S-box-containing protein [Halorubrum xinjiangense]|uniref:histidine kinase n=1 Tax=Halorubrum xinjiangense TaxID=261291 RepID=A0A1G7NP71_9EURY|nr:PAS domain-containing sensor histidine kinase [Halorubrum xinjiangense]SDF75727.1 PAS domain S-box-containing protein [Halorubrum xinjiangense]